MNSRQILRRKILNFAKWTIGCAYLLIGAPGHKSKIVAFVFHEVSDKPSGHARLTNTYSSNKNFMKQIALLTGNFRIIDPLEDPQWANKSGCLITFDDGYKGALDAAKTLEDSGIASTHLLNLETIYGEFNSSALIHFKDIQLAKETKWSESQPKVMKELLLKLSSDELKSLADFSGPYMNPEELKELISLTRVSLGDHFLNHWYGNSLTDEEIKENLYLNARKFHGIDKMGPYFASPHGEMDDEKIRLIIEQGYEVIFSGSSWRKIGNTPIVPRIDMNNSIRSKASLFGAIAILILRSKIKAKN
jgi:peptidoglycan/xylan/chitin deacetylase (PgdA/CDA1 family)